MRKLCEKLPILVYRSWNLVPWILVYRRRWEYRTTKSSL